MFSLYAEEESRNLNTSVQNSKTSETAPQDDVCSQLDIDIRIKLVQMLDVQEKLELAEKELNKAQTAYHDNQCAPL